MKTKILTAMGALMHLMHHKCLLQFIAVKERWNVKIYGKLDVIDASDMLKFYSNNSVSIQSDYVTEKNMEYLGVLNGDGMVDSSDT